MLPEWPALAALFTLRLSPFEIVLRGSAMYWFLFLLFRFVLRRDAGALGIADILLLVLIADASQNARAGGYDTVAEGMLLVGTIALWNWLMDALSFRFKAVRRFAEPSPLVLVRQGQLNRRNLRRELITTDELMASLREQGIASLAEVDTARIEANGEISVIRKAGAQTTEGPNQRPRKKTQTL